MPARLPHPDAPTRGRVSAGLLMYRMRDGRLEVFIARPGGPWFPHRETDVWTIPKGEWEPGESLLDAAIREFNEEVGLISQGPYIPLGSIRQKGGKTVHAWGFKGDLEPGRPIQSSLIELEWPPGSGRWRRWPEIERAQFMEIQEARTRLKLAQQPFLDRLRNHLRGTALPETGQS